jgi:hypothetical protein
MPSLKDRMATFQQSSSPEKFDQEKRKKQSLSPKRTGRSLTPPPSFLTNPSSSEKKKVVKGNVVENRVSPVRERPKDWTYLNDLAVKFDQFKLEEAEEKKSRANSPPPPSREEDEEGIAAPPKDIRSALEGVMGGTYTAKADWLNKEWIDERLVDNKEYASLTFRFNDPKLFKKFTKTDEENRDVIIRKFVGQLLEHPRSNEITRLDLSRSLLPDDFLLHLSEEVLKKPTSSLPKVQVLNLESNLLQGPGIEALAKMIRHDLSWKYLQVVMLENQGKTMTSVAETALANAIGCSSSMVVCSLRVRGPLEKKEIDDTVAYNMDQLRQARR